MPLPVLVVGRAALLQQEPQGRGVEGRRRRHAEKGLGQSQEVAAVPVRQGDQGRTRLGGQGQDPALRRLRTLKEGGLCRLVQTPQYEDLASGQEGPVQFEGRVLGGGTDQGDHPLLHPGQEAVLLGAIETVDFIHKQEGGLSRMAPDPGLLEGLLEVRHPGKDGGDLLKLVARRLGEEPGDGRLAHPGRAPEDHGGQPARGRHAPDGTLGRQKVVLPSHLAKRPRPQTLGQRCRIGRGQARSFEQVGHRQRLAASRAPVRSGNCR